MSSNTSKTKADALAFVQALIAGTQKHLPSASFTLDNVPFTTASLVQLFQSLASAMTGQNTAQSNAKDAVATTQGLAAKVDPVIQAYKSYILAQFNTATQTLADFGIEPRKARTPLTVEQKAAAAAKLRATRAARGTTSPKKKLAISGNVTGVTITPTTTPASPSSPTVSNASSAPAPAPISAVAPVVTK
jgi:hypothetical protein